MRRRGASALGLLISAVSLGAVAWWIARQPAPELPESGTGFAWLALALATSALTLALRGLRWHRVLALAGIVHRQRDAYGLTLVAYMGNNVLPARGGELLRIGLLGQRTDARRREILGTVVADRVLDAAILAALFAGLTFARVKGAPSGRSGAVVALALLALGAVGLVLYVRLRRRGRFERFASLVRPVARASHLFAHRKGIPLAALSVVIWVLEGVTFMLIARAVAIELSLQAALAIVVLASLAAAIPAAPGYAGTFDAALLVGLHAADVVGGEAVTVLLLARFLLFVPVTLAGLGVLVFGYGVRPLRRSAPDDQELLAEGAPGERRREVPAGQRGARG